MLHNSTAFWTVFGDVGRVHDAEDFLVELQFTEEVFNVGGVPHEHGADQAFFVGIGDGAEDIIIFGFGDGNHRQMFSGQFPGAGDDHIGSLKHGDQYSLAVSMPARTR